MKIQYIVHRFVSQRDTNGNVYDFVRVTHTETGKTFEARDLSENNIKDAMARLHGGYYYAETVMPKKQFMLLYRKVPYYSSDSEELAFKIRRLKYLTVDEIKGA